MKLTTRTIVRYGSLLTAGGLAGLLLHFAIVAFDRLLFNRSFDLSAENDFFATAFAMPFLPVLVVEVLSGGLIFLLWSRMRLAVRKAYQSDLKQQRYEATVKSMQKLVGLLANHITSQNTTILNKLNFRKSKGQQVSETIEEASFNIGKILRILSEESFVEPYLGTGQQNTEDPVARIERRIQETLNQG